MAAAVTPRADVEETSRQQAAAACLFQQQRERSFVPGNQDFQVFVRTVWSVTRVLSLSSHTKSLMCAVLGLDFVGDACLFSGQSESTW